MVFEPLAAPDEVLAVSDVVEIDFRGNRLGVRLRAGGAVTPGLSGLLVGFHFGGARIGADLPDPGGAAELLQQGGDVLFEHYTLGHTNLQGVDGGVRLRAGGWQGGLDPQLVLPGSIMVRSYPKTADRLAAQPHHRA